MYEGYRVVVVIPAGRERTVSLLLKHLRAQRPLVDGVMLWMNTDVEDDIEYLEAQQDEFVQAVYLDPFEPVRKPKQLNTGRFFAYCTDPNTIYIRFDDDVVWLHQDSILNLLKCRFSNPDHFVIFANIWNNAVTSALHQEAGHIGMDFGPISRHCLDDVAWKEPAFGPYVHQILLANIAAGTTRQLYLPNFELGMVSDMRSAGSGTGRRPMRFSVSAFAFWGKDWAKFHGVIDEREEEQWVTGTYPTRTGRFNLICGDALVAHYSFFTQRPLLDRTSVLQTYSELADDAYHDAYYRLLELAETPSEPFKVEPWWETDPEAAALYKRYVASDWKK